MRAIASVGLAAFAAYCLAFASVAARAADTAAPDFSLICKKAVKRDLGLDKKKEVRIEGKRQNSEGFTVLDFKISDGRKGSCLHYKSGKISEVKMRSGSAKPTKN